MTPWFTKRCDDMADSMVNPIEMALREQSREINRLTAELNRLRGTANATSRGDYARTIDEIRLLVARHIAPGNVIAVVSRGDDELLKLHGLFTRHFPSTADGAWAGQYPEDGAGAIEELQSARERGARYLLIPSVAFWWLDFYPAFAAYLGRHAQLLHQDGVCRLYELAAEQAPQIKPKPDVYRHMLELLNALLPEGVRAIVANLEPDELPPTGRPLTQLSVGGSEPSRWLSELPVIGHDNARFLVIPDTPSNGTSRGDALRREATRRFRLIASRAGVCDLFDLMEAP